MLNLLNVGGIRQVLYAFECVSLWVRLVDLLVQVFEVRVG